MTRLLCFGDLHLGARAAHEREPGDGLADQRAVLERIVEISGEYEVDAIVCAGDIFEGPTVTPEQYALVQETFADVAPIVVAITGNGRHDCAMRDVKAPQVLSPMMDVYTRPAVHFVGPSGDTALCLLPWVHPGRLVAEHGGGDRDEINATAAQLLLRAARDMSDCTAKHRVLVFHGSIEGAGLPNGIPIDTHASDILPIDGLLALGFDAVVASHIHVPQTLHLDETSVLGWLRATSTGPTYTGPIAFYTGSPLPLNFGEGDYEHGVWLLDLDGAPAASLDDATAPATGVTASFIPIESRGFVTVDVDLTTGAHVELDLDETDAVAAAIAVYSPLEESIVRIRIRGTEQQCARVDVAALKPLLDQAHKTYIAFDTVRGNRARVEQIDEEMSELDAVELYIAAHDLDDDLAKDLRDATARYLERIGAPA